MIGKTYNFIKGVNAKTGEVAIEELQIAHEGLRLVRT
jgi:hypothetical protein